MIDTDIQTANQSNADAHDPQQAYPQNSAGKYSFFSFTGGVDGDRHQVPHAGIN